MLLNVHEWGDLGGVPLLCVHGLSGHGARFRRLAELLPGRRLMAPDLRGHARSGWAPPWRISTHAYDLTETLGALEAAPRDWLGFSFGARLVAELATTGTAGIERVCLLDPALSMTPELADQCIEAQLAGESFASPADAIEASLESGFLLRAPRSLVEEEVAAHLAERADGRFEYRYSRAMAIVAFSELVSEPPPVAELPTLVVTGDQSWVPVDTGRYPDATLVQVPGGHSVLMDSLDETGAAVAEFLDR